MQEKLPRFGGSGYGGPRPSKGALQASLVAFGLLTLLSAIYIVRHAGSPEAWTRYPGLPAFSLSLTWVLMIASELLRDGSAHEDRFTRRRVGSAVPTVVLWFALIPAAIAYGATIAYAASGIIGVLGWTVFFALVAGLSWLVGRYSGPRRRRSGR